MINSSGLTPKIMPPDVATAFPPLKRAKSGYVCPKTAKTPIARRYTSAPNRSGIKVATVPFKMSARSEEHTPELQSLFDLVCRLLLVKKHRKMNLLLQ